MLPGNSLVAGVGDPGSAWIRERERGCAVHLLMGAGVTDPGYKSHPVAAEVWLLGFEMS